MLGHEGDGRHRRKHGDVEPRYVIGDEEHASLPRHDAIDVQANADDAAHLPVIPIGKGAGIARAGPQEQELERHQRKGEGKECRQHEPGSESPHDAPR